MHDLLRAHFPGVRIGHLPAPEAACYKEEAQAGLLVIERRELPAGYDVRLQAEGRSYEHREILPQNLFPEEDINRQRRLLRLAVYRVLSRFFADGNKEGPSPWGVLTGVRPTKIVHRLLDMGYERDAILHYLCRDYGISKKKALLVTETALYQRPYLPGKEQAKRSLSLYIGIPFCPSRCAYCSFPSYSQQKWGHMLGDYLTALQEEMEAVSGLLKEAGITIRAAYLGGGTPTLLSAAQLDNLLGTIENSFLLKENCEITVEGGRPDTLERDKLLTLKKHGTVRLSINPQTMCESTLRAVGRSHTIKEIVESYLLAREIGLPVINMDLIIGLPGENRHLLGGTLQAVLDLRPENITLHALALKRAAHYRQERVELPSFTEGQAMLDLAQETLARAGYIPYYLYRQKEILAHGENVGYTTEGYACLYNIEMMEERLTIAGFGVGAGSKIVKTADWSVDNYYNPRDLLVYLNRLGEIKRKKVDKLRAFVYNNF